MIARFVMCFFFQAEDGIRDLTVTGVQTCALPISARGARRLKRAVRRPLSPAKVDVVREPAPRIEVILDRKSTRLNSSHSQISYAVFCLKKKKINAQPPLCFSTHVSHSTPAHVRT